MKNRSIMKRDRGHEGIRIPRTTFDRTHRVLTALDAGFLVPIFIDEVYPGETININAEIFGRVATMLKPVMDTMHVDLIGCSCAMRVLWPNFVKMMGERDNPNDSIDYTVPTFTSASAVAENSLADYLGLPIGKANVLQGASALPFRLYNRFYNDWVRRQDLIDQVDQQTGDGPDNYANYTLLRRMKRPDYFTSAAPYLLKGGETVTLPLGTTAPVVGIGMSSSSPSGSGSVNPRESDDGTDNYTDWWRADTDITYIKASAASGAYPRILTDLAQAAGATPQQFRQTFQIGRFLERDMRSGTRFPEFINAHFGVQMPHSQWRSEFLGYSTRRINVTPVANTSGTATEDQGQLTAFGTVGGGLRITKSFDEHSYVMILANIRCDLTYSQGIRRMWTRSSRFDFMHPEFSHVGDQAILNKEIFFSNVPATDNAVFGYAPQYEDLRTFPSTITSVFRPDAAASLDAWHYSEDFPSVPVLGSTFVEDNPPVDRTIAVASEPHVLLDGYIHYRHTRPLPAYGTPGLTDHI